MDDLACRYGHFMYFAVESCIREMATLSDGFETSVIAGRVSFHSNFGGKTRLVLRKLFLL